MAESGTVPNDREREQRLEAAKHLMSMADRYVTNSERVGLTYDKELWMKVRKLADREIRKWTS